MLMGNLKLELDRCMLLHCYENDALILMKAYALDVMIYRFATHALGGNDTIVADH